MEYDETYSDQSLMVTEEVKEIRLVTCMNCDKKRQDLTCSECDCFIPLMVSYTFKSCPIAKWQ